MSPETFAESVREYCQWAESNRHDARTVHRILLELFADAPRLKASDEVEGEPKPLGLPQHVEWVDTKRFADFPFQYYPPSFWPEAHPEGPFTDNIHEDFAHIYAELRHGLQILEQGDAASAAKYWRDSYFRHWGHHASAAVFAIKHWGLQNDDGQASGAPAAGHADLPDSSKCNERPD